MAKVTGERKGRQLLVFLGKDHTTGKTTADVQLNMVADAKQEPQADPRLGPANPIDDRSLQMLESAGGDTRLDLEDGRSAYSVRGDIEDVGPGQYRVPPQSMQQSFVPVTQNLLHAQARFSKEATEFELNGTLPASYTPQSARVDGQRPNPWQNNAHRVPDHVASHPTTVKSQPAAPAKPAGPRVLNNSQAGLAAHQGPKHSVPSVPRPGEPGSRFNPIVKERGKSEPETSTIKAAGKGFVQGLVSGAQAAKGAKKDLPGAQREDAPAMIEVPDHLKAAPAPEAPTTSSPMIEVPSELKPAGPPVIEAGPPARAPMVELPGSQPRQPAAPPLKLRNEHLAPEAEGPEAGSLGR